MQPQLQLCVGSFVAGQVDLEVRPRLESPLFSLRDGLVERSVSVAANPQLRVDEKVHIAVAQGRKH